MFKTILVPLDGSAMAEQALPHALHIAGAGKATVVLVRAAPFPHRAGTPQSTLRVTVRDAEEYLAAVVKRLDIQGIAVRTEVMHTDPVRAITFTAHMVGADLIVMSTHVRSGIGRVLLGSVADAIIAGTDLPIMLLHAGGQVAAPGSPTFRHILVPLDGSRAAETTLTLLHELPLAADTEITLLRAAPATVAGSIVTGEETALLEHELREAETYLSQVAERHASNQPYHLAVVNGQPGEAIVQTAGAEHCDLIAMVTHGRTGFGRFLHGSVAWHVLNHATVPLLVLRDRQAAKPMVAEAVEKDADRAPAHAADKGAVHA